MSVTQSRNAVRYIFMEAIPLAIYVEVVLKEMVLY